jgi:hypothetical protein
MARLKHFQEFADSSYRGYKAYVPEEKQKDTDNSRQQVWAEFNRRYQQLYGNDRFEQSPHHKSKKASIATKDKKFQNAEKDQVQSKMQSDKEDVINQIFKFSLLIFNLPKNIIIWFWHKTQQITQKTNTQEKPKTRNNFNYRK